MGTGEAAATSRAIAAVRMPEAIDSDQPLSTSTGLTDLIGVANIRTLSPSVSWRPRPARDRLRVAIGVGTTGQAVELDIKEAAQGGMGPHGLVVGATGSGKSELLRTLVLGLAITHPPDSLNFVLVDFKGGATFNKLDALPHTSAVITNLSDELGLVDRMRDAISGELNRRMELLRSAGSFASLRDYDQARAQGADLAALPTLLIVVDEFSELLAAKPDFLDLFITIGRVGRSLGVHLLLASQRLEEGRLRGLDTYLSYRIGLKTFSVAESRIVLGAADAFELPTAPGNGYLKFDTTGLVRFKSAYVSGPVRDPAAGADDFGWVDPQPFRLSTAGLPAAARGGAEHRGSAAELGWSGPASVLGDELLESWAPRIPEVPVGTGQTRLGDDVAAGSVDPAASRRPAIDRAPTDGAADQPTGQTLLDVAVGRLTGSGVPAHEVWLPPLREPPTLDLLLPSGSLRGVGHDAISVLASSFLQVPLGWVDKPYDQTRDLLTVDMSGAAGNVAIVGGPQSGKSTALRSLLCGLALTHTPAELQLYCLDFGGGSLAGLAGLPHVGVVAGRLQPELVHRTVAMVNRILTRREQAFTAAGIGSLTEWRERVAAGTVPGDGFGDVFLVVDGWGPLKEFFEPLESQLTSLATRGLNYGVHVVVTAGRWPEIRAALKDMIGSRIELRLGDPLDSEINAKLAASVPQGRPGRGISRDRLHLLTAVPRIDGKPTSDALATATAELVRTVATRWTGPAAPAVKLLPAVVRSDDLPAGLDPTLGYPLGLDEELQPVFWNPPTDQHLLIFGEEQSGKSTVLRRLIRQISARHGLDGARFIVFDAQRRLLDLPYRPDQLIASATNSRDAAGVIAANVDRLQDRLPPRNVPRRDRPAWLVGIPRGHLPDHRQLRAVGHCCTPCRPAAATRSRRRHCPAPGDRPAGKGCVKGRLRARIQHAQRHRQPGACVVRTGDRGCLLRSNQTHRPTRWPRRLGAAPRPGNRHASNSRSAGMMMEPLEPAPGERSAGTVPAGNGPAGNVPTVQRRPLMMDPAGARPSGFAPPAALTAAQPTAAQAAPTQGRPAGAVAAAEGKAVQSAGPASVLAGPGVSGEIVNTAPAAASFGPVSQVVKVSVRTLTSRIDLVLPDRSTIAETLETVLELAPRSLREQAIAHGGWILRTAGGTAIPGSATLLDQRITDGTTLFLSGIDAADSVAVYDDVADAVADTVSSDPSAWPPGGGRVVALAAAGLFAALLLLSLLLAGPPWVAIAITLAGITVIGQLAAGLLSRGLGDAGIALVAGLISVATGAAAAMLASAGSLPLTDIGAPQLLLGAAGATVFGTTAALAIGTRRVPFAAIITGSVLLCPALICCVLFDLPAAGGAAIAAGLGVCLLPVVPNVSLRLARFELNPLPTTADEVYADHETVDTAAVRQRTRQAVGYVTALLQGLTWPTLAGCVILAVSHEITAQVLAGLVGFGLILRARLFITIGQRLPLLVAGIGSLAAVLAAMTAQFNGSALLPAVCGPALFAVVCCLLLAGRRRRATPGLVRAAEIVELLIAVAVIPLVAAVLGLFGFIRGLGG